MDARNPALALAAADDAEALVKALREALKAPFDVPDGSVTGISTKL